MSSNCDASPTGPEGLNRRAFLRNSSVAAGGVAVTVMTPAAVVALEGTAAASPVDGSSGPLPAEPVMAYVSDPARGEVTVLSGLNETTYRDPVLARRLLKAASAHTN